MGPLNLCTSDMDIADFGKVSDPDLDEIQETESGYSLSFREIFIIYLMHCVQKCHYSCIFVNFCKLFLL